MKPLLKSIGLHETISSCFWLYLLKKLGYRGVARDMASVDPRAARSLPSVSGAREQIPSQRRKEYRSMKALFVTADK